MPRILIDAHEDIAYSAINFNRDYSKSSKYIREIEINTDIPSRNGHAMLGYEDWKKANVAMIFSTLFIMPKKYQEGDWEKVSYKDFGEARSLLQKQIDFYHRLENDYPEKFLILKNTHQYKTHWRQWEDEHLLTKPIGLVLLMEGADGIRYPQEIEEWYHQGLRIIGLSWAGGKYSGGMYEPGGITHQGRLMMEIMVDLNMGLDIAHMSEEAALQALDIYEGVVFCSHANVKKLINGFGGDRHLSDLIIKKITERNGVIGLMPYNNFLDPDWTKYEPRDKVPLNLFVNHIDHICQLTGNAENVAIGTDFDGGFGYPEVPFELNSIADLPKLADFLTSRGYNESEIRSIFGLNWKRITDRKFV